jgi:hypothetical protein
VLSSARMRASAIPAHLAAVLALFIVGCAALDGSCRSQAECGSAESCVAPGARRACGIPCPVERECEDASDCDTGEVCAEFVATCCFAGELSSRCAPACTDGSCAADERCDASSGLCSAIPCDDGHACPEHTSCRPAEAGADVHGCTRDACGGDGDCPGGACVDGLCYAGPGACEGPVP